MTGPRKRGGQPGNRNRLKHGRYAARDRERHERVRKLVRATRNLAIKFGMMAGAYRALRRKKTRERIAADARRRTRISPSPLRPLHRPQAPRRRQARRPTAQGPPSARLFLSRAATAPVTQPLRQEFRQHLDARGPGIAGRRHQMQRALGQPPLRQHDLERAFLERVLDDVSSPQSTNADCMPGRTRVTRPL